MVLLKNRKSKYYQTYKRYGNIHFHMGWMKDSSYLGPL